jgi:hypothetical protein
MIRSRVLLQSCTTIEMGAQAQHVLEEEDDAAATAARCWAAASSQAESGREVI